MTVPSHGSDAELTVSLDANILIWAMAEPHFREGDKPPPPHVLERRKRAQILVQDLTAKRARIVLSWVAVGEFLSGINPARHQAVVQRLHEHFEVYSLDEPATMLAAQLWATRPPQPANVPGARAAIKADTYVVATARSRGASVFYSDDQQCREIAKRANLIARGLPERSEFLFDVGPPTKSQRRRRTSSGESSG